MFDYSTDIAAMIELSSMKHAIIPRIKKLCLETDRLSDKFNPMAIGLGSGCLVCIGKLLEHMDKWFVLDEVLPMVMQIPSKEPAVLMGILGIIKMTISHKKLGITKDIAATKVLPFLFPLCIDNSLNLNQFNAYMTTIKELVTKVETDHKGKLEQLNSLQEEHKTSLQFAQKLQDDKSATSDPFVTLEKKPAAKPEPSGEYYHTAELKFDAFRTAEKVKVNKCISQLSLTSLWRQCSKALAWRTIWDLALKN
ncbi:putative SCY1-like protein 2-like [Apostichopus japonicus]|uniref:Putative SCY1-like protein 2-like n=1 Tax=Stichopus japonicus TaxID=307972 RepID=A0A2G8LCM6_STIJA|nr:putative SCY1-like protein 2-like [Apostichopus japonicus]